MPELPHVIPSAAPAPAGTPWPTHEWPRGDADPRVDEVVAAAFDSDELATTNAVVVVRHGRLIAERYAGAKEHFDRPAEPIGPDTPLISWSMAKSMVHTLIGTLVDDGRLDPTAPAPVPEWRTAGDPRGAITLADLLAMRDGLDYTEDYVDDRVSDVIEMLFGSGQSDMAAFTAAKELAYPPGTRFNYSSGTTNVLSRIVADHVGYGDDYDAYLRARLFEPIGMTTATATYDGAGVFVGSSFVHAVATDFAKFGLLYLRGGEWDGRRVVSRAWVDTAQVPHSLDEEAATYYAWQWWVLGDDVGSYAALGYDGQMIVVVPALDAVFVRLGRTPAERNPYLRAWRRRLIDALRP